MLIFSRNVDQTGLICQDYESGVGQTEWYFGRFSAMLAYRRTPDRYSGLPEPSPANNIDPEAISRLSPLDQNDPDLIWRLSLRQKKFSQQP